jgi:hypothetical protein
MVKIMIKDKITRIKLEKKGLTIMFLETEDSYDMLLLAFEDDKDKETIVLDVKSIRKPSNLNIDDIRR